MDATCNTCPFYQPETQAGSGNPEEIGYCRSAAAKAGGIKTPFPGYWCSEHPLRQRDRLAAMAMQGLVTDPSGHHEFGGIDPNADRAISYGERVARAAYCVADAMLSARG